MKKIICAFIAMAISVGMTLCAYADNSLIELDGAIFEGITPYSDSSGIIYSEAADGYYRVETDIVTFFSAVTGKESQVLTLSDGFINSVYSDERYIYLSYNLYTYDDTDETRIIRIDTLLGDTETIFTSDKYVTAVGVDDSGRLYLAANDEVIYIYSKDGNLLTQVTAPKIVYSFAGFDSDTGNFFFTGYYNWIYWGYDHSMNSLYAGNFKNNSAVVEEVPYLLLSQNGYNPHMFPAEEWEDKYLLLDNTFNSQLQILDMESYVVGAEENKLAMAIGRTNTDEDNDDSCGVRAVYDEAKNSIITFDNADNIIIEYDMKTGDELGRATPDYPVYALDRYDDTLVIIEKDKTGGKHYLTRKPWTHATSVSLSGKSTLNVGKSTKLTFTANGTIDEGKTFTSSDTTVATVTSDGTVYGWHPGTAVITVTTNSGLRAQFTITVTGASDVVTPAKPDTTVSDGTVTNNSHNNESYYYFGRVVDSYVNEEAGIITRVENTGENVLIEQFDSSLATLKSKKTIEYELPIFGGCYFGDGYNYLVFGKTNPDESDEEEVIRVVKYDKNWKRLAAQSIKGANTYIPFDAGSLRMTETGGYLYIHTSHEMYASDDGLHHQANMTFKLNISDMSVADSWYDVMNVSYGYVSHSFNQFIETDGEYIYRLDHGDAYPRSIVLTKCRVEDSITDVSYASVFDISGNFGQNYTGVTLGGLAISDETCIAVGNSVNQADFSNSEQRNVFISVIPNNFSEEAKITYLTQHAESSNIKISAPEIIKFTDNGYLVMWEEIVGTEVRTCLVTIDKYGNKTSEIKKSELTLSDCRPIVLENGLVSWYVTDNSAPVFYKVNPFDLDAVAIKVSDVSGFKVNTRTSNALYFGWNKVADADGYVIEQYKNGEWVRIARITNNVTTSYRLSGLTSATLYKLRICGYRNDGTGAIYSNYTTISARTNPGIVTDFAVASRSSTAIRLGWTKTSGADGYIIEQKTDSGWTQIAKIASGATVTYKVSGLSNGAEYKFRIKAYKADGSATLYSDATVTLTARTLPSAVKNFTASVDSPSQLTLKWTKNSGADGYIIEQFKSNKWTRIVKITSNATTSYKVTGLTAGDTFKFRMRTYAIDGSTALYSGYTSTLAATTVMSSVEGFTSTSRSTTAIRLGWTRNTAAEGYIIEQFDGTKWVQLAEITDGKTVTYKVTGLVAGTAYKFRMKAYSVTKYGERIISEKTETLTANTAAPSVSGLAVKSRSSSAVRLTWKANKSVDGYVIEIYNGSEWKQVADVTDNTVTEYKVTKLDPSVTYQLRIRAYMITKYKEKAYSAASEITATTLPSAVEGLKIGGRASNALRLNWTKNKSADGYIIEQYIDGEWTRIARIAGNSTVTYRIAGLTPSTKYNFRIKAYNIDGSEALYSNVVNISGYTVPKAVTNLAITGRAYNALRLGWDISTSAKGYIIEQYIDGKWTRIAKIESNETMTFRVSGLTTATEYKFRVTSYIVKDNSSLYSAYAYTNGTTL